MAALEMLSANNPQMAAALRMVRSGNPPEAIFNNVCASQGLDAQMMRGVFNQLGFRI